MPLHELLSAKRIADVDNASLARAALERAPLDRAQPASPRERVLDAAARLLAGRDKDPATIAAALRRREALSSTAIGFGVSLPHARCAGIDRSRAAFLRLAEPVDFGAPDGEPVDLVVALLVPEQAVEQHLDRLAALAERFADPEFRAGLRQARTLEVLHERLLVEAHQRAAA